MEGGSLVILIGWYYCEDNQLIPFQGIVPGLLPRPEQDCDYNLGDVILGMPVIAEECGSEGERLEHRLPVIVAHSLCHLLGYKHRSSAQWRKVREKWFGCSQCHAGSFTSIVGTLKTSLVPSLK